MKFTKNQCINKTNNTSKCTSNKRTKYALTGDKMDKHLRGHQNTIVAISLIQNQQL